MIIVPQVQIWSQRLNRVVSLGSLLTTFGLLVDGARLVGFEVLRHDKDDVVEGVVRQAALGLARVEVLPTLDGGLCAIFLRDDDIIWASLSAPGRLVLTLGNGV